MIEPWGGLAQADSTSSPTQSERKITSLLRSFLSSSARGCRLYLAFLWPSGLPRWEQSTTDLAPLSRQYLIEGRAATLRALLVMAPVPLSWGTLKSHLMKIRSPAIGIRVMGSLFSSIVTTLLNVSCRSESSNI